MSAQIGYIRVSSIEQNTERQLLHMQLDKIFTDKCSGKKLSLNDFWRVISTENRRVE